VLTSGIVFRKYKIHGSYLIRLNSMASYIAFDHQPPTTMMDLEIDTAFIHVCSYYSRTVNIFFHYLEVIQIQPGQANVLGPIKGIVFYIKVGTGILNVISYCVLNMDIS